MKFSQWLAKRDKAWWRYGNYCGPGPKLDRSSCDKLSDGSPLPLPQDQLDKICMRHDIDYCHCGTNWKSGLPGGGDSCSRIADDDLLKSLLNIRHKLTPSQLKAASVIGSYFTKKGHVDDFIGPPNPPLGLA